MVLVEESWEGFIRSVWPVKMREMSLTARLSAAKEKPPGRERWRPSACSTFLPNLKTKQNADNIFRRQRVWQLPLWFWLGVVLRCCSCWTLCCDAVTAYPQGSEVRCSALCLQRLRWNPTFTFNILAVLDGSSGSTHCVLVFVLFHWL